MPTPSKSPPPRRSAGKRWVREVCEVWLGGWRRLWPRLWIILAVIGMGMVLVIFISPQDNALLAKIRVPDSEKANNAARFLSRWGDLNFSGPLSVLLWFVGAVTDKARWRKLGLALLMASLVSGGIVDVFRASLGRPRPYYLEEHANLLDGFYGPHWWKGGDLQSYPSGHACVSATTGSTLLCASPLLAVPGTAYALAVSWSRLQLDRHHPIDVTVGAAIGTICGLCYVSTVPGAWVRLKRKRKQKVRKV